MHNVALAYPLTTYKGIAFSFLIVRVGLGLGSEATMETRTARTHGRALVFATPTAIQISRDTDRQIDTDIIESNGEEAVLTSPKRGGWV